MSNNILDNSVCYGKVGDFLKDNIQAGAELSFVSAYFTIHAFYALQEQLSSIKRLHFLFGEPTFLQENSQQSRKIFNIQENNLELSQHLKQKSIAKTCATWIKEKVEIKTIDKPDFLHAKLYLIKNPPSDANRRLYSVVGSSNFTVNGLGFGKTQKNLELNLITDSNNDMQDLEHWFNELWNNRHKAANVKDVKKEVLKYLEQLYSENTPDFIYHKTLHHLFSQDIAFDEFIPKSLENSEIWSRLYEFQKNAVKQIIYKINQYNGCILADSVGLGKTFTALAIIKYFELRNQNVLVLSPKKLRENWRKYQISARDQSNIFERDKFNYALLSHTDLTRTKGTVDAINLETFNWNVYDLIVIDESHHFRNATEGYQKEDIYIQSRYEKLLHDVIKSGVKTKVLLLSATPVNNNLMDLLNQIRLITHDNDDAFKESLHIESIKKTLDSAQKSLDEIAEKNNATNFKKENLIDSLGKGVTNLLDNLTIARSRQQIKTYFADSIQKLGNFPQRKPPQNEYIELEPLQYSYFVEQINKCKFSLYNPSAYIKDEYRGEYVGKVKNFNQQDREYYLIGMMRVNFLKRLESSIFSFKETLQRTVNKIKNLEEKLTQREKEIELQATNDLQEELENTDSTFEWGKLSFKSQHLDIKNWLADLKQDEQQLNNLLEEVKKVAVDSKLQQLHQLVRNKVTHQKINQGNRKVLVFTAFADTASYLYHETLAIAKEMQVNIALVKGSGENQSSIGEKDFEKILTFFSPKSKERNLLYPKESKEIDILIATDCISEGQNLQDCDYVINYDIHWNPVRLIQRFGRIDRLGSHNEFIQMVNFWAGNDLESYLNLEQKITTRMALVSATTTTDENLLEEQPQEVKENKEKNYRDHQLLLFKENVPELDSDGIQLEDLSFTDFRLALQRKNNEQLENAPLGMYAVIPENKNFQAGVVFCLKVEDAQVKAIDQNYLHPYFLVYVKKREKTIHYHFTEAHQILTIFRDLCLGKTEIYEDFCNKFDEETQQGIKMDIYNELLKVALASFETESVKKASLSILQSRKGRLLSQEETPSEKTQFSLITWLIIQEH